MFKLFSTQIKLHSVSTFPLGSLPHPPFRMLQSLRRLFSYTRSSGLSSRIFASITVFVICQLLPKPLNASCFIMFTSDPFLLCRLFWLLSRIFTTVFIFLLHPRQVTLLAAWQVLNAFSDHLQFPGKLLLKQFFCPFFP